MSSIDPPRDAHEVITATLDEILMALVAIDSIMALTAEANVGSSK